MHSPLSTESSVESGESSSGARGPRATEAGRTTSGRGRGGDSWESPRQLSSRGSTSVAAWPTIGSRARRPDSPTSTAEVFVPANAVPVSSVSVDGFEPQEARCHDRDVTTERQESVLLELTSSRNSGTNSGTNCISDTGQVPMQSRPGRALGRSFPEGSRLSPRVRIRYARFPNGGRLQKFSWQEIRFAGLRQCAVERGHVDSGWYLI